MYADKSNKHTFKNKKHIAYGSENKEVIFNAAKVLIENIDEQYGGFGTAAKTISPEKLLLLLNYYKINPNAELLKKIEKTLYNMYKGGIFDHLGYGFFRSSKVRQWTDPVLQKMLYDNLILIIVYSEAYGITSKKIYSEVVEKIYEYLVREMMNSKGGFYFTDGEDKTADNEFYTWNYPQIEEVLGKKDAVTFCKYYNIPVSVSGAKGIIPNQIGISINRIRNDERLNRRLIGMCNNLYLKRHQDAKTKKNYKIYSSLNSLAVAALAHGGRMINNSKLIASSEKTLRFIYRELSKEDGRLIQCLDNGKAEGVAHQRTYAYLIWALIELYYSTLKSTFLNRAIDLNEKMIKNFWDEKGGGFFTTESNKDKIFRNTSSINGNEAALLNFVHLNRLSLNSEIENKASKLLRLYRNQVKEQLDGYEFYIIALIEKNSSISVPSEEINNLMAEVIDINEKE